jgi:tetratricopeptide (TPR) repeat protein
MSVPASASSAPSDAPAHLVSPELGAGPVESAPLLESTAPLESESSAPRVPRPAKQRSLAELAEARAHKAQEHARVLARTTAGDDGPFAASTQLRELERLKGERKPRGLSVSTGVVARPNAQSRESAKDPGGAQLTSLVAIGLEFHAGKGLQLWLSQQVRAAHRAEQIGRDEEAATLLRQAFAQCKDPRLAAHAERLSRRALEKTVDGHRENAEFNEEQELWNDAAAEWEAITKVHPDDGDAHFQMARCLLRAGDLKGAGRPAMRATELLPESIEAREILLGFFEQMNMKLNAQREREAIVRLLEARAAKQ